MLIHVEQDIDVEKAIHKANVFVASLSKGQLINLQINTFPHSTQANVSASKDGTSKRLDKLHLYNHIIMIYYDVEGSNTEIQVPKHNLSS